jgi:hypothetical protein
MAKNAEKIAQLLGSPVVAQLLEDAVAECGLDPP